MTGSEKRLKEEYEEDIQLIQGFIGHKALIMSGGKRVWIPELIRDAILLGIQSYMRDELTMMEIADGVPKKEYGRSGENLSMVQGVIHNEKPPAEVLLGSVPDPGLDETTP